MSDSPVKIPNALFRQHEQRLRSVGRWPLKKNELFMEGSQQALLAAARHFAQSGTGSAKMTTAGVSEILFELARNPDLLIDQEGS